MANYFGNSEKDNLLEAMERFLENHTVAELLEVASAAVESVEEFVKRLNGE